MTRAPSLVAFLALTPFAACSGDVDRFLEGRDHVPPIDARDNVLEQGIFDCTERSDTGFSLGDPFAITVVAVDGKPVERETANAYVVMQEAAAGDGVDLRIVSGFRTMEQQEYLYGCYVDCNCNNCNLAAEPGYSNHQSGHALDLNTADSGVYAWLDDNGGSFGFERTVPSEDWHWEWWGGGPGGGPCTGATACQTGEFVGAFCDDEGSASEEAHECLAAAGVDFGCEEIDGSPAACGARALDRATLVGILGDAFEMPLEGHEDGFADDDGHPYEAHLNAAKDFGIIVGDGANVDPDGAASRTTIAIIISRMFRLPAPSGDYFVDDNGTLGEVVHNQLAEIGFTYGCGDDGAGGRKFCGDQPADRSTLARFTCGLLGRPELVPVWALDSDTPEPPIVAPDDDTSPPTAVGNEELLPTTPGDDGEGQVVAAQSCATFAGTSPLAALLLLIALQLAVGTRRRTGPRRRPRWQ